MVKGTKMPEGTQACAWHACLVPVGDDPKRHMVVCASYMRLVCLYCRQKASAEADMKEHIMRRHAVETRYLGAGQTGFTVDGRSAKEMLQAAISSGHVTIAPPVETAVVTKSLPAPKAPIPRLVERETEVGNKVPTNLSLGTELDDVLLFDPDYLLDQEKGSHVKDDEEEGDEEEYDPEQPALSVAVGGKPEVYPLKPASLASPLLAASRCGSSWCSNSGHTLLTCRPLCPTSVRRSTF